MGNDFFDELGVKLTKTAKDLGEKAEQIYEAQKLRNKIASEERVIDKVKADIGNILYKRYVNGEALDDDLVILCQRIDEHLGLVAKYKEDLADMRGRKICPSCQEAISKTASFCPNCGAACPTPEPEEEVVDIPEEDVEVVEEPTVEEAVVEEAVEEGADVGEKTEE